MTEGMDPDSGEAGTSRPPGARRRPWLAFLLSLLVPGLGQLYAGRARRAFGALLVYALALGALMLAVGAPWNPLRLFWSAGLFGLVVGIAISVDAARVARRPGPTPHPSRPHAVAIAVVLFVLSVALQHVLRTVERERFRTFVMSGESMSPTLLKDDYLLADVAVFRHRKPARGDVVVYELARGSSGRYPADERPDLPRTLHVCRIVGIPGDHIVLASGRLSVNGVPVPETPAAPGAEAASAAGVRVSWEELGDHRFRIQHESSRKAIEDGAFDVPPGRYFLMGDARDDAYDSRLVGSVGRAALLGRVVQVYFSWDAGARRVRWGRVGRVIR